MAAHIRIRSADSDVRPIRTSTNEVAASSTCCCLARSVARCLRASSRPLHITQCPRPLTQCSRAAASGTCPLTSMSLGIITDSTPRFSTVLLLPEGKCTSRFLRSRTSLEAVLSQSLLHCHDWSVTPAISSSTFERFSFCPSRIRMCLLPLRGILVLVAVTARVLGCATLSCDVDAVPSVFEYDVMFNDVDRVINGEHKCVVLPRAPKNGYLQKRLIERCG